MEKKILVIDDDESIISVIKKTLEPDGYSIISRKKLASGVRAVQNRPDIILLDFVLPDGDGLEGLREIHSINPEAIVIMIVAHSRMQDTITAMKEGAYDYLKKPFEIEELQIVIEKAFRALLLREELKELKKAVFETEYPQLIGKVPRMLKVLKDIQKVAPKDVPVLIMGKSGTGKELVAKAIHYNSRRSVGPFITIDFTSIPKNLFESELFGYKKGAFRGADKDKTGKIEAAAGGTLFLNEVSEMESGLQAKLLHFLQKKEFTPFGCNKPLKADVRIIGASRNKKNLAEDVSSGNFREDLYFRFNAGQINLPLLMERKEDIPLLVKNFLTEATEKLKTGEKALSEEAKAMLLNYDWPGNVRELENVIRRACILSRGAVIDKKDLLIEEENSYSMKDFLEAKLKRYLKNMRRGTNFNLYGTVLSEAEKALITIVLRETDGNQVKSAEVLGINRNTLRTKIKEYKIKTG